MSNKSNTEEVKKVISIFKNFVRIKELDGDKTPKFLEDGIKEMMPDVYKKYPKLAKLICSKENTEMLDKMVKSLELIEKGKNKKSVEKKLGEELAETYIYPLIKNNKKN